MKKMLVCVGVGGVMFAGTVLGLLAVQGRLNHAGTRGIPLLSSVFPSPSPPQEGTAAGPTSGAGDKGKPPGDAQQQAPATGRRPGLGKEKPLPYRQGESLFKSEEAGNASRGAAREGAQAGPPDGQGAGEQGATGGGDQTKPAGVEQTAEWRAKVDSVLGQGQYRPGRLWTFPQIEAGIGVDELNEILRRARDERAAVERDRGTVLTQQKELEARERDIADRQDAVMEKLREVEQLRAKLQTEIDEFHNTVLLIRHDETSGLQAVAKTLGTVEPRSAAAVIKKWWETDEGQSRALKIWTVMDPDAANAILAELDVEMIRQVLEKRLKVAREQAKAKK